MRSWGIRPKLVAVVLVPIIAALVLGGIRLQSSLTTSTSYSRLGSLADLLPRGDSLSSALQAERTATAGSLATPAAAVTEAATLASARTATDSAVTTFRSAIPGVDTSHDEALQQRLSASLASSATLPALRAATDAGGAGTATVVDGYGAIVAQLSGLTDSLTSQRADASVTSQVTIVRALADAKEADAERQAIIYAAALRGSLSSDDLSNLVVAADHPQYRAQHVPQFAQRPGPIGVRHDAGRCGNQCGRHNCQPGDQCPVDRQPRREPGAMAGRLGRGHH